MTFRIVVLLLMIAQSASPGFAAQAQPDQSANCVEVQIGQDRVNLLNCLNQSFGRDVAREHATPKPEAPMDALSSSSQIGIANESVARQRMGSAFGVSTVPQRPACVFVPSLPVKPPR